LLGQLKVSIFTYFLSMIPINQMNDTYLVEGWFYWRFDGESLRILAKPTFKSYLY